MGSLTKLRNKTIFFNFYTTKEKNTTFAPGEMAEWSIAAVLKTVEGNTSGGSNPSFSASLKSPFSGLFLFQEFSCYAIRCIYTQKFKGSGLLLWLYFQSKQQIRKT